MRAVSWWFARGREFEQGLRLIRARVRYHDGLLFRHQALCDFDDLFPRFSRAEDDFGKAVSESAMVVHPRMPQILEGQVPKARGGVIGRESALLHLLEQFEDELGVHERMSKSEPRPVLSTSFMLPERNPSRSMVT